MENFFSRCDFPNIVICFPTYEKLQCKGEPYRLAVQIHINRQTEILLLYQKDSLLKTIKCFFFSFRMLLTNRPSRHAHRTETSTGIKDQPSFNLLHNYSTNATHTHSDHFISFSFNIKFTKY